MFLDLEVLSETYQLRFSILSKNKQSTVYVFFVEKALKKKIEKVNTGHKTKSKVQIMFFEINMKEPTCR